jgi:AcrR family transcriptional regulator
MAASSMKRDDRSRQVRENILSVSRDLFIRKGYSATTIRQILSAAGISTGTLYHFFRDKEDILYHLTENHLDETNDLIYSLVSPKPDYILVYTMVIALLLSSVEKYEHVAELYLAMYRSWSICDMICRKSAERNPLNWEKYCRGRSDEWWYARSLAVTGIIQNCIADRMHGVILSLDERLRLILDCAFAFFSIPRGKMAPAIARAGEIMKNNDIVIYGISIS